MIQWLKDHQAILYSLGGASVAIFIASLFIGPWLVLRIPPDYFTHRVRPPAVWAGKRRAVRITVLVVKNLVGLVLLIAGVAMLALPGQGLLTMLIGFLLLDGPGKYRAEKWLIARPFVHRPINWFRCRRGRVPLRTVGAVPSDPR